MPKVRVDMAALEVVSDVVELATSSDEADTEADDKTSEEDKEGVRVCQNVSARTSTELEQGGH